MKDSRDWENFHDGLCPKFIGDGECRCHVAYIAATQKELEAALLQIDAMRPVVEAAIMWADYNNNVTDTVPWLERAVLAYKDATEKRKDECICGKGFGMNLSCPLHGVR